MVNIINAFLASGVVPSSLKMAAVIPTLKKQGSGLNNPNNSRPISNLPILSKILERAVAAQLQHHMSHQALQTPPIWFQTHHSTETTDYSNLPVIRQLMVVAPAPLLKKVGHLALVVDGCCISPSPEVRNLGVILDSTLSFRSHITTKSAFYHLRNISRLRPSLTQSCSHGNTHPRLHHFPPGLLQRCRAWTAHQGP